MSRGGKRHPIRGLIGGLLLGVGVTLLLISYGKAPFGLATAWVPLVVFVVLGLVVGLLRPMHGAQPAAEGSAPTAPTAPAAPEQPAAEPGAPEAPAE